MMEAKLWRHEWLDHFSMHYYRDMEDAGYETEEQAVAAAKIKLAKQKEEKASLGIDNELNDWLYVVGPDGAGYRIDP
jgi:hypothetical protein